MLCTVYLIFNGNVHAQYSLYLDSVSDNDNILVGKLFILTNMPNENKLFHLQLFLRKTLIFENKYHLGRSIL